MNKHFVQGKRVNLIFVFNFVSLLCCCQISSAKSDLREDLYQSSDLQTLPLLISPVTSVVQNWRLEEIWTLGGEDEDDVPLGFVKSVVFQANKIYALDTKESKIYVMDLSGNCLDVIDVSGDAPGQCSNPNSLLSLPNNLFALIQGQPAKIIVTDFYKSYPYSKQFLISEANPYSYVIVNGAYYNANKFLAYTETSILLDRDTMDAVTIKALSTFSGDGQEIKRYFFKTDKSMYKHLPTEASIVHYAYRDNFAIDKTGTVYVAPYRDEYLLYIFSPSGQLQKIIGREFSSRQRNSEEKFLASFMGEYQGQKFEMVVEDTEADILAIHVLDDQLLIRHSYSEYQQPKGVYTQLDLFDSNNFVAKVNLLAVGTAKRDQLFFLGNDLLAVVKGNKDFEQPGIDKYIKGYKADPTQLILYRIHKNP